MSGNSSVGSAAVYEGNEQRNKKESEVREEKQEERYHEGKENAHNQVDPKDERSIANRLAAEEKYEREGSPKDIEQQRLEQDATLPARAHGNKPSRGAEIDQEIREEEEAYLAKKDAAKEQSKKS